VEITSATAFSIVLNASADLALVMLLNKDGLTSTSGTAYNLAVATGWAPGNANAPADLTANPITVSNVALPQITSAAYNAMTGTLVVTGAGFLRYVGATNDINVSKLSLKGEGNEFRTLTSNSVEVTSDTQFTVNLNAVDIAALGLFVNKNGLTSTGNIPYNLAAAEGWAVGAALTSFNSEATNNQRITVSLSGNRQVVLDVEPSDSIENVIAKIQDKTGAPSVGIAIYYNGALLDQGRTLADYNIATNKGVFLQAELNTEMVNAVTASAVPVPTITGARYDTATGVLVVTGTGLVRRDSTSNDIDISKLKFVGQGGTGAAYTLISANDVEITSGTSFSVTLSGADKAAVDTLMNKTGTQANDNVVYNLAGLEDWAAGADAALNVADEAGNAINVTVVVAPVDGGGGVTPVTDTDGVSDATENGGPGLTPIGGGAAVAGDGNGDGVADSQQSGVTSTPFRNTDTAVSNPGTAAPVYLTLVADARDGKIDSTDGNTATLTNVHQLDAPANLPSSIKMPLGLISFSSNVGTAGTSETFSLYVDLTLGANAYFKQNAAGTWVNLASAAHGGKVVIEGGKTRLDFQIKDGGEFDSDGKADGVITDPGAPGLSLNTGPTIDGVPSTVQAVTTGIAAALANFTVADAEQGLTGLSLTLAPTNGTLNGLTDTNTSAPGIQLSGTAASLNAAIAAATFTAAAAGTASIGISLSDGVVTTPVTLTYSFNATSIKDSDKDQFPDALEAANGLTVGTKDNDVFTSSKFFAMQLYRDILYREGETAGVAYWQDRIDTGLSRAEVAVAFLDSPEFQAGTGAIARLYFGALGRLPDAPGMSYWMEQQQSGTPISQIAAGFAASTEFTALYGGLSNTAFIQTQYQNVLGRTATTQEQTQWNTQLAGGTGRGVLLLSLTESNEYKAASDVKLSVALDYLGLLGRPAEQAGFDYWVNQQSTVVPEVTVVGGFIASQEYHDRFLP
jgi:hypothetical protein